MNRSRHLTARISLATTLSSLSLAASSAEQILQCPAEVKAASFKLDAPPGYKADVPSPFRLTGASLMYGPPETRATSVPQKFTQKRGKEVASWAGLEHSPVKWMACLYEEGLAVLSQPIDAKAKTCTVIRTKSEAGFVIDARCSW